MPDPFRDPDRGAFLSFLDWLGRPGQAVMNGLQGRGGSAGRQLLDFLGEIPDAVLPGDWIPNATRPEDETSGSELVGIDRKAHPILGTAADIGVGLLTDPLTYLAPGASVLKKGSTAVKAGIPFTKFAKEIPKSAEAIDAIKGGVSNVYNKVPEDIRQVAEKYGTKAKYAVGKMDITKPIGAMLAKARGQEGMTATAHAGALEELLKGVPDDIADQARDIVNNRWRDAPEMDWREIDKATEAHNPAYDTIPLNDGAPLSDLPRSQPAKDHLKIIAEGLEPVEPSAFDRSLGAKPAGLPTEKFPEGIPSLPEGAYGIDPTDPRFASGIDLANKAIVPRSRVETHGPKPLKPSPSELPTQAISPAMAQSLKAVADATEPVREWSLSELDELLGAKGPKKPDLGGIDVPVSQTDALNAKYGVGLERGTASIGPKETRPLEMKTVKSGDLPELKGSFDTVEGNLARWQQRVDQLALPPERKAQIMAFLEKLAPYNQQMYKKSVERGTMFRPEGIDLERQSPADYTHNEYMGLPTEGNPYAMKERGYTASSLKEKFYNTGKKQVDFLNENKGIKLPSMRESMASRAQQEAQLARKTTVGKSLIQQFAEMGEKKLLENDNPFDNKLFPTNEKGEALNPKQFPDKVPTEAERAAIGAKYASMADQEFRAAVDKAIPEIAKTSPDDAAALSVAWNGLKPNGPILDLITNVSKPFKKAAVMGYIVPKISFLLSNRLSDTFQTFTNPEARGLVGQRFKTYGRDFLGAVDDAIHETFGFKTFTSNQVTQEMRQAREALRASGGDVQKALDQMSQDVREAMENNVIGSGIVDSEKFKDTKMSKFRKLTDLPAEMMRSLEDHMRYGMFKELKKTHTVEDSARITEETLYPYYMTSNENKITRTFIPFFQFMAHSSVKTAKLIGEKPAVGVGLAQLMQQRSDSPVYPYMEGGTNLPFGPDEAGNEQYVTNFRLPFESLSLVPSTAREFEKNIVGSSNPLMKTAYSAIAGHDPYFNSTFGSYDKIPAIGHAGKAGQLYNEIESTGLIQPIDSLLRLAGKATNPDTSAGRKALDLLTGLKTVSVDEDLAIQQQLQDVLRRDPNIKKYESLVNQSDDPATQTLLDQLKEAKKRLAAKRKNKNSNSDK